MSLSLTRSLKRLRYRYRDYPEREITLKHLPRFRFSTHIERDDYVSTNIRDQGLWEPFETDLFLGQIASGDTVVDIGANIGWYSVLASLQAGPGGSVLSFEPSDENFAILARNLRRNGLTNVHAYRAAIGSEDTKGELYLSETNRGDHQLNSPDDTRSSEKVSVRSLAGVLRGLKSRPSVLKIDTQGSEQRILQTVSPSDLSDTTIFIEFWPHGLTRSGSSVDGLLGILSSLGHGIFIIDHGTPSLVRASVEELKRRAVDDLRPETMTFVDLFCLPAGRELPERVQAR
ncbi:MAG: FkbM family methyltransferase [Rhizobiales bacterium]|nr:FkbM family methyltransferase [Hyphomicrobiales bacterium]